MLWSPPHASLIQHMLHKSYLMYCSPVLAVGSLCLYLTLERGQTSLFPFISSDLPPTPSFHLNSSSEYITKALIPLLTHSLVPSRPFFFCLFVFIAALSGLLSVCVCAHVYVRAGLYDGIHHARVEIWQSLEILLHHLYHGIDIYAWLSVCRSIFFCCCLRVRVMKKVDAKENVWETQCNIEYGCHSHKSSYTRKCSHFVYIDLFPLL